MKAKMELIARINSELRFYNSMPHGANFALCRRDTEQRIAALREKLGHVKSLEEIKSETTIEYEKISLDDIEF